MKAYIVEKEALISNIRSIVEFANGVPVWGVLKGNGYGLGVQPMARLLWENGVTRFAVTELREAELLRELFPEAPILMLRSLTDPQELHRLMDLQVILTVGDVDTAETVNALAGERADVAEVHLAVDTGMGRYGFLPSQYAQIVSVYEEMKHIAVSGIFTHFHSAFCSESATKKQFSEFAALTEKLRQAGYETGMQHCCNSSAFLKYPEMHLDGVRIGSAFLGRLAFESRLPLQRIGYAECTVEALRELPKGHTVGYGAGFVCKEPTQVAIAGVGWYNGFGAERENDLFRVRDRLRAIAHHLIGIFVKKNLVVTVNGCRCRVLGHVGMVHTAIDVTGLGCQLGDKVVMQVNPLNVKGLKVHYK